MPVNEVFRRDPMGISRNALQAPLQVAAMIESFSSTWPLPKAW